MSSWFGRKKTSNIDNELKQTQLHIETHQKTNSELRRKLEEVREAARRNKILLDELLHTASQADSAIAQLRSKIEAGKETYSQQEASIAQLIKNKLMLENRVFPTSQAITSSNASVQEILDSAETGQEQIYFKDTKGQTWEILKRSDLILEEGDQSSSDLSFED